MVCCCAICRRANTNAALAQGKVEYVDMSFSDYLKRDHSCIGCIYRPDSGENLPVGCDHRDGGGERWVVSHGNLLY